MDRRTFLASALAGPALPTHPGQNYSDYSKDPRPDVPEGTYTAGSPDGPVFMGHPVVSGPAPDAMSILHPLARHAAGYLEYAVGSGGFVRVETESGGMHLLQEHVLKVRLPALPPGKVIRYRFTAWSLGWVKVRQFYHGELKAGKPQTTPEYSFRTLDPGADLARFAIWNDTHENSQTLRRLDHLTQQIRPDFLLWNGDQSNDVHFERDMARQFLNPDGLNIAASWPLAYVRGNHDVRGPAALSLNQFTGTPEDRNYYAFRSGPVASLVMDTGEDKPDDDPAFCGTAAFQDLQRKQAVWLKSIVKQPWFSRAPFKLLFCHIPLWFTRDIFPTTRRWECHHFCREQWLPHLVKAGVSLVISGHTHDPRWMPANADQPIAQLIGGGPHPDFATLIQGEATRKSFRVVMSKLDGSILNEITLNTR